MSNLKIYMDENEIIQDYKYAANKREQVKILADQNCCKPKEMAQWLVDHGQDVDKRYLSPGLISAKEDKLADGQKKKADAGKPKLSLVPVKIIFDIAKIREYGNAKYPDGGPDNWKQVDPERYRDAAFRHFLEYIRDPQGVDEESGMKHLWHVACNIAFLCELEDGKNVETKQA